MKILCVAEKPSIAKSLAEILASDGFSSRPGKDKYCRNFDLSYRWQGAGWADMTITSVRGHLTENDFTERHRKWYSCDPLSLFEAPMETRTSKVSGRAEGIGSLICSYMHTSTSPYAPTYPLHHTSTYMHICIHILIRTTPHTHFFTIHLYPP